jgi:choline dehydrogenase-like flavoprotein
MIFDFRDSVPTALPSYAVCIVGSGPAGTSLANALADSGHRICVLESGGRQPDPFADRLRDLDATGMHIKDYSRERIFGGASTTWAGLSSPLDAVDFEKREWVAYSGWPFSRRELVPHYQEATRRFRFPAWERYLGREWMGLGKALDTVPHWRQLEEKVFLAADPPQNFARDHGGVYAGDGVDLCLGTTVTAVLGDAATGLASGVEIRLAAGCRRVLRARVVVLACGGIENARLLLNSTFGCPSGLGNDRDQVGRYFMNHPKNNCGLIRLKRPQSGLPGYFGFLSMADGCAGYVGLRLNEALQRERRLVNSYVRFEPVFNWTDNPGVAAVVYYLKRSRVLMRIFRRINQEKVVELRDYSESGDDSEFMNERKPFRRHLGMVRHIAANGVPVGRYLRSRLADRSPQRVTAIRLRNFMEMEPLPENRITLSDRTDAFGMRLPRVYHRCSPMDRRSIVAVHEVLRGEVTEAGWGELDSALREDSEPWPIHLDASHHMGATRMGDDPATSVTNGDGRLHFSGNVYLAGSSLFPTSGCANPTFTIVALALRLAGHLRRELSRRVEPAKEAF